MRCRHYHPRIRDLFWPSFQPVAKTLCYSYDKTKLGLISLVRLILFGYLLRLSKSSLMVPLGEKTSSKLWGQTKHVIYLMGVGWWIVQLVIFLMILGKKQVYVKPEASEISIATEEKQTE